MFHFRKLVLNWLAEIIDALPQEDNGLLTLPLLLKLSHAIIDIGKIKFFEDFIEEKKISFIIYKIAKKVYEID